MEYLDTILCGDCVEILRQLPDSSTSLVVTSPPYAMQRKNQYGGISESDYPDWTVAWMEGLRGALTDNGSVLIVIRSHIKNGQVSDYVMRTRLAVRAAGWLECEELIWHKPDAPPLGSLVRPRRNWENILWYSKTNKPYCNLLACGNIESNRIGGYAGSRRFGMGQMSPIAKQQRPESGMHRGTSRCSDVFRAYIGEMAKGVQHPAMFPLTLAEQLILTFSSPGDMVTDPFVGSGTTAVVAKSLDRHFCGIEIMSDYCDIARDRLGKISLNHPNRPNDLISDANNSL